MTPTDAAGRSAHHYTHTTADPATGEAVHHVVVYTFSDLYDRVGTAHHFTARADRWGVLVLDQELTDGMQDMRHRAINALYDARNHVCLPQCHIYCRRSAPGAHPKTFCSTPAEIDAEMEARARLDEA